MKTIKILTVVAIVLGLNAEAHSMGWGKLKFWKKKEVACVDTEDCVDPCTDEYVTTCAPSCGEVSRPTSRYKKVFSSSKNWLSDICHKDRCTKIRRFKWLRGDNCIEGCINSCVDESCVASYGTDDEQILATQDASAPKNLIAPPDLSQPLRLPQLAPLSQKRPLQSPKVIPTPKATPRLQKERYFPKEDATSFIMPRPRIQKLFYAP